MVMPSFRRILVGTSIIIGGSAPGALLAAADEVATDYWARVMPAAWFASLGGEVAYQDGGTTATTTDVDELGLGDRTTCFAVEAGAQIPFLFGFHAGFSSFSTSATTTLTRTVTFGTQTYAASDVVDSSVSLRDIYGEICVRPINLDLAGFSLGIAVHGLSGTVELTDQSSGASERLAKTIPIPVAALRAHVAPFWALGLRSLTLEGRLHYFDMSISGDHLRYADADLHLSYAPMDYLGIIAGYRHTLIDLELDQPGDSTSSAALDLTLSGPYVGVMAKF